MNNKYSVDMLHGAIVKKMLIFTLPIMFSGIMQLLYNAVDIAVVGRFSGKESLAAVGSTGVLINFFTNFFMGISTGACIALAHAIGRRNKEMASRIVNTSMSISLIIGIVIGILGIITSRSILKLVDTPDDVMQKADLYMKTYFMGMPAFMIYNFGSALLRAAGDTKRPMYVLLISGIINIIFNLIFVIIFKLDVVGVGLGTVISQVFSAVIIVVFLVRSKDICHYDPHKLRIHKPELLSILRSGVPTGIQSSIFTVSNVMIQAAVNSFGSVVVAANSTAGNIEGFVYIAMHSIYETALTFTSQNYGAGNLDRIRKIFWSSIAIVSVIGIFLGMLAVVFSKQLIGLYTPDETIVPYANVRLYIICGTYFLCGIMEVLTGLIRGLNCSVLPMIVSVIGVCGIRICWIIFVFPIFRSVNFLYYSYPLTWSVTTAAHLICFCVIFKKIRSHYQSVSAS